MDSVIPGTDRRNLRLVHRVVLDGPVCGSLFHSRRLNFMNSSHMILFTCFLLCSARGWGTGYLDKGMKVRQGVCYMVLLSAQSSAPVRQLVH